MQTKKSRRARTEYRKQHIRELTDQLNQPNSDEIHPFTKYKLVTYILIFVFPPYAMYRVWKKDSSFTSIEQIAETFVEIVYVISLLSLVLDGVL